MESDQKETAKGSRFSMWQITGFFLSALMDRKSKGLISIFKLIALYPPVAPKWMLPNALTVLGQTLQFYSDLGDADLNTNINFRLFWVNVLSAQFYMSKYGK